MGLEKLNLEVRDKEGVFTLYSGCNGNKQPIVSIEPTRLARYVISFEADAENPKENFNRLMLFLIAAHRTHDIPPDIRGGYCEDPLNRCEYPVRFDASRAYDPAHADEMFSRSSALCFSMETDLFPFIGLRSDIADKHGYLPGMWVHHKHSVILETGKNISHDLAGILIRLGTGGLDHSHKDMLYPVIDDLTGLAMEMQGRPDYEHKNY
ncbi:hypothetical protein GF345_02280 [Candidatus Woesearchaeota archaeon]|nr:hypothetical protein [Candidatus Woesearchaeota archaeon]